MKKGTTPILKSEDSDDLYRSPFLLSLSMIIALTIYLSLATWAVLKGPRLAGWDDKWNFEVKFGLGCLFLFVIITIIPISLYINRSFKLRNRFTSTALVMFGWPLLLTVLLGMARVASSQLCHEPLESDFISWGSIVGAYLAILTFISTPLIGAGLCFRWLIRVIVNFTK